MTMTIPDAGKLLELADRVLSGSGCDNALDVLVEVALFEADQELVGARPNAAGTKVIYTCANGSQTTHWADEWSKHRGLSARLLRARAASSEPAIEGEGR
jgi:hypothetical protein